MEIVPTILTSDPPELLEKINTLEERGVQRVHIDIVDGEFSQGKSVSLEALERIETQLILDIHLMVAEPVDWAEHAIRASAERIIGQVEMMNSQVEFVGKVTEAGLKVGLALDIDTPTSALDSQVLKDLDAVLIMGRKAGFDPGEFRKESIGKVGEVREVREKENAHFKILVDGGVNRDNMREIEMAGADEICVGRAFEEILRLANARSG